MPTGTLPKIDRTIRVADSLYKSAITQDKYAQRAYESHCSTLLVHMPDRSYNEVLSLVPAGHRMSVLDEIAYLIQRENELKSQGKNPREVLKDALFERQIKGNPHLWEWTHVAFRAPKGRENFENYVEKDAQGRIYYRGDYAIGDKIVAEGVAIPQGNGRKVVEWNESLRMPAVTSDGVEPQHTTHHYFDPSEQEVAVELYGFRFNGGHGRCLYFYADCRRSDSDSDDAFRMFQGSLEEVPLQTVKYAKKG